MHTRASGTEDEFARTYGVKFAVFSIHKDAVEMVASVRRMRQDMCLNVLRDWLHTKVSSSGNSLQWVGFTMTPDEIDAATAYAYAEWMEAYV